MKIDLSRNKKWFPVAGMLLALGITKLLLYGGSRMAAMGILEVVLGVLVFLSAVFTSVETEGTVDAILLKPFPRANDWETIHPVYKAFITFVYAILSIPLAFGIAVLVLMLLDV